jgi:hypothetical protein
MGNHRLIVEKEEKEEQEEETALQDLLMNREQKHP